jgi:hypothetical protein
VDDAVGVRRALALGLIGLVWSFAAIGASPALAAPSQGPTVDLGTGAGLAPDGRSLVVDVIASCPERWIVHQATVTVSQTQATGQGSFPLTCIGSARPFRVTVRSSGAAFRLGQAQASALVVITRGGRTQQARDSEVVSVDPTVTVDLADRAVLSESGAAVLIDVAVACPVGANGQGSYVSVSQGETRGNGNYVPICDGAGHTFRVTVRATLGLYRLGAARALSFAFVEEGGDSFSGVDDQPIQIVAA